MIIKLIHPETNVADDDVLNKLIKKILIDVQNNMDIDLQPLEKIPPPVFFSCILANVGVYLSRPIIGMISNPTNKEESMDLIKLFSEEVIKSFSSIFNHFLIELTDWYVDNEKNEIDHEGMKTIH